jgi:hypothetical protein
MLGTTSSPLRAPPSSSPWSGGSSPPSCGPAGFDGGEYEAAVQLLVLVGLLLVQSVAVLATLELVARGRLRV